MSQVEANPLLEPLMLKHLRLRTRFVSTSHEPGYAHDGMPTARYRQYHVEKAKGGVALTMIGGSAVVARDSPATFGNLHIYDDSIVPWLGELSTAVHEEGALVMCQLTHLGPAGSNYRGDWLPGLAASAQNSSSASQEPGGTVLLTAMMTSALAAAATCLAATPSWRRSGSPS